MAKAALERSSQVDVQGFLFQTFLAEDCVRVNALSSVTSLANVTIEFEWVLNDVILPRHGFMIYANGNWKLV